MRIEKVRYTSLTATKSRFFVTVIIGLLIINVAASAQSVGDIAFDPKTDDPKFELCDRNWVWQGYELKTKMDETSLTVERELKSNFRTHPNWSNQNAIVRIRFIVNCHGAADRFRVLALDFDLKQIEIDESLKAHLVSIARQLQWPVRRAQSRSVDYYHYFSVKITNGRITDVMQ
jgi:hypothetical protein